MYGYYEWVFYQNRDQVWDKNDSINWNITLDPRFPGVFLDHRHLFSAHICHSLNLRFIQPSLTKPYTGFRVLVFVHFIHSEACMKGWQASRHIWGIEQDIYRNMPWSGATPPIPNLRCDPDLFELRPFSESGPQFGNQSSRRLVKYHRLYEVQS